jgi:hypothetical protein
MSKTFYLKIYYNQAIMNNLIEDVQYFLQLNIDINKKYDPDGRTALIEGKIYNLH